MLESSACELKIFGSDGGGVIVVIFKPDAVDAPHVFGARGDLAS